jgi:putative transposase
MKNIHLALQALAREKTQAWVKSVVGSRQIGEWVGEALNRQLSEAFNAQLEKERDEELGRRPYERQEETRYRNGFKRVFVPGFLGPLELKKPVLRKSGGFVSETLKALRAGSQALVGFLGMNFWLKGASTRAVAAGLNEAFGTKMTASHISQMTNALEPTLREWEKKPLPAGIQYLYLDALYLTVKRQESGVKQALLVAIGVDGQLKRHFLGFLLGDRESEASWTALVEDLLKRGLDRQTLRMVVSDAHGGILAAVKNRLGVTHQLCVVHKMKNVRFRVAWKDQKAFMADFKTVYWAPTREEALVALGSLQATWSKTYPKAVEMTGENFEAYTQFFGEDPKFWLMTRSSNLIERFNLELRKRFRPAGMMQNELELTKLVWAVAQAQQRRWERLKVHTSRREAKAQAA